MSSLTNNIDFPPVEVRIGVVGNVDAGKSSFVGVMTHPDILDNGRGYARELFVKHKHERETGRTSDITQNYIRTLDKITDFIDLAGHEKYLKTTIKGINSNLVDYAIVVINANAGIQQMTREHISIVYTLRIPIIIIYTKIDITPENVYNANLKFIKSFFTKQKIPITTPITTTNNNTTNETANLSSINIHVLDTPEKITEYTREYCAAGQNINYLRTNIPIISISNVSGFNIPETRQFLTSLQQYHNYNGIINDNIINGIDNSKNVNFMISTSYNVKGVGLVVTGVLKTGIIKVGDILNIGPFHNYYYRVIIRGIHNNFRENVDFLSAGYSGCLAIKPVNGKITIKKNKIRSGVRIVSVPQSITEFQATVRILQNPTTISKRYTPIIQCAGITQPANILQMDKEYLRSYDESTIHFKFIYRPEYIEDGALFVFREGLTKGVGKIKNITVNPNLIIE